MKISWRYSQVVEILEYDLFMECVKIRCIDPGANQNMKKGEIYSIPFEDDIPGIKELVSLIEKHFEFYVCD